MAKETKKHEAHDRCEYNRQSVHRINRIIGQLNALKAMIEADEGSCEERVIRGRAIEKGVTSLITHMVECYLENTARQQMLDDPEGAVQEISRIFDLLNQ